VCYVDGIPLVYTTDLVQEYIIYIMYSCLVVLAVATVCGACKQKFM